MWVITFRLRPLYHGKDSSQFLLNTRLATDAIWSILGRSNYPVLPEIDPRFLGLRAHRLVHKMTDASHVVVYNTHVYGSSHSATVTATIGSPSLISSDVRCVKLASEETFNHTLPPPPVNRPTERVTPYTSTNKMLSSESWPEHGRLFLSPPHWSCRQISTVYFVMTDVIETSGRLHPLWPQDKRLHTPRTTDHRHTRQDRWIQTELVSTLTKNAIKPNPFEIILLQTTRKENNWKTEETLERAVVTLKTERIKGSNPLCLWWWWWWSSNDTIGNRTRDLPDCSAVPQSTAPPLAPVTYSTVW